jgi:hypothetical protein
MRASMSMPMSLKILSIISASCLLVALAVSFGASWAAAASPNKHLAVGKHRVHSARIGGYRDYAGTAAYRDPRFTRRVESERDYPYIPANAIRMPGYIFVPGVGILGESCDLPTSACSNEYRDIQ